MSRNSKMASVLVTARAIHRAFSISVNNVLPRGFLGVVGLNVKHAERFLVLVQRVK
jgi:hypothetical protein